MYHAMGKCAGNTENTERQDERRAGTCAGRPVVAHSTFMRAEEIERERELSGWNPYAGEEEEIPQRAVRTVEDQAPERYEEPDWAGSPQRPYFLRPDYDEILQEEKTSERDLRRLESMYPDSAKQMLPYVEEECDKMEYEGSPMYDEHPDLTTVYEAAERIYGQVSALFPEEADGQEEPEEVLSMQYREPGKKRPGRKNRMRELARVLLLQEMHHRRCRHRRCRRHI